MVAQLTVNQLVAGSNPATRAKQSENAFQPERAFCLETGVFLVADELLGVLLATPSGMAFGTIELPKTIPPRLDRPRIMQERPSASTAPIRLARRLPERPLQPPNQQEDNHHDRPHRQTDQPVIAVVHRLSDFLCSIVSFRKRTHCPQYEFTPHQTPRSGEINA